jgi:hypothetical protein
VQGNDDICAFFSGRLNILGIGNESDLDRLNVEFPAGELRQAVLALFVCPGDP